MEYKTRWQVTVENLQKVLATQGASSSMLTKRHPLYGMFVAEVERLAESGRLTHEQRCELQSIGYEIKFRPGPGGRSR